MNLRYLLNSGKNSQQSYYLLSYLRLAMPKSLFQKARARRLREFDSLTPEMQRYVMDRVEYYCKLDSGAITELSQGAKILANHTLKNREGRKSYFFDTYEYTRYFDDRLHWEYLFGDITTIPSTPSIVKSRPIEGDNRNSVVLKLNKNRHFITVKDRTKFEHKRNLAIFRGDITGKEARWRLFEQYFNTPMCDLGVVSYYKDTPIEWRCDAISIFDHLKYKFVFALEGNDVASNLKWVMSSNSLAVMPQPTYETWFMEGRLVAGEHFVQINPDFSNIEEQLNYYIEHPLEAKEISRNASRYVEQFMDRKIEDLISLMVLERYFRLTGQGDLLDPILL